MGDDEADAGVVDGLLWLLGCLGEVERMRERGPRFLLAGGAQQGVRWNAGCRRGAMGDCDGRWGAGGATGLRTGG